MNPSSMFEVAVDAPLPHPLTYSFVTTAPASPVPQIGDSVVVPLGRRACEGVVVGVTSTVSEFAIKSIVSIDDQRPRLTDAYLRWVNWLSHYYMFPIGQVVRLAFPPLKKQLKSRRSARAAVVPDLAPTVPPTLTAEQETCVAAIASRQGFHAHLLFGVTGSGKTEVYLRLLAQVLERGQQGLVLVPEISLTPQLIQRFAQRFGQNISVLHSHLTEREKTNQWWDMVEGRKQILIGARSALFCPLPNLGLIIVDEEHEPSFKQDEKLKYHGRDAAVMKAKIENCPVVLGSATPSLESWQNVETGKYQLHKMSARVRNRALPEVHVVDLRAEREKVRGQEPPPRPFWLSEVLNNHITETLKRGEQVALFLNRRGVAQSVLCQSCGVSRECPNCAVTLTLHGQRHLVCHYCDYHEPMPEICPTCRQGELIPIGLGTELVEKDMAELYPGKKLARADRDEIQGRETLEELIDKFEKREIDVLIGTQMIAKGLDFPGLTLVGLVLADVGFNFPDFRAAERSFQLLTQVSGRAGRHLDQRRGQVVIQTYNPQHISIQYAQTANYEGFAARELAQRRELGYPPCGRLTALRIQGAQLAQVEQTASTLAHRAHLLAQQSAHYAPIQILGPVPAPLAKLRGKFRYHIFLKGPEVQALTRFTHHLLRDDRLVPPRVRLLVDVDPIHVL